MQIKDFQLSVFAPEHAPQEDWVALNRFLNRIQAEALPDDPPVPLDETIRSWSNIPVVIRRNTWTLRPGAGAGLAALGCVEYFEMEDNRHMAQVKIQVLPEHRRKGLGTALLSVIARNASDSGRRLLICETNANVPDGAAFLQRFGASVGLTTRLNQLKVAALDRRQLEDWQARARERAAGYELLFWHGPYPEDELPGMAGIKQAMNQQPLDNLDVEAFNWTEEILRQVDATLAQRGIQRWTFVARQKANRALAGFTEVFFMPAKPEIAQQGDTAVLEAYRNRGIGRWLKAAMLEKVLQDRPLVKFIRTTNAESNAPMLKINRELGFAPYLSTSVWQVEIEQVLRCLALQP